MMSSIAKDIAAEGGAHPSFDLFLMRTLVRTVFPVANFRGLDLVARNVSRMLRSEDCFTRVRLNHDTYFSYPTYDSYWGAHFLRGLVYEPTLLMLFKRIARADFAFIDCGANYGYWSAILTSADYGAHECVAIEGSPSTFSGLKRNAALNNDRFACIQRAIWSQSNETITFMEGGRHAGRHAGEPDISAHPSNKRRLLTPSEYPVEVETVTIADTAKTLSATSLLIKLDVEGSELRAFDGAEAIAEADSVFIYEDHGADPTHEVTRTLLSRGFMILFPHTDGRIVRVNHDKELTQIKHERRRGYNFLAYRGSGPLTSAVAGD